MSFIFSLGSISLFLFIEGCYLSSQAFFLKKYAFTIRGLGVQRKLKSERRSRV
jgi:hypothetical protein